MKDLVLKSLKAHKRYVVSNIGSTKSAKYYQQMMDEVIHIVEYHDNYVPIVIQLYKTFAGLEPHPFDREIKYKEMAVFHAMDVVLTIHERFLGK